MNFLLLFFFISTTYACKSSPPKVSLIYAINKGIDGAENKPIYSDPARNILKAADRNCVNEKLSTNGKDREVEMGEAAFALSMISFLCAPDEHLEKCFDYYYKIKIDSGLSLDCIVLKLESLTSNFTILKNLNSTKTREICEREISAGDKKLAKDNKIFIDQSYFKSCDEEFHNLAMLEDYLQKYLQDKPATQEEYQTTRDEFVRYNKETTQMTIDCILKKLNLKN